MYLDGFGKFLVIFVKKYIYIFFLPLLKKLGAKKSLFWQFFKNMIFSQKSDYLNRFLVNFPL